MKRFLQTACCIFTPSIILFYAIGLLSSEKGYIPSFSTVCIVFALSFLVSLTSALYEKTSFLTAHLVNFLVLGVAYYLVVVVLRGYTSDGAQTLIAMLLYVILFVIATVLLTVIRSKKKRLINDVTPYESRF